MRFAAISALALPILASASAVRRTGGDECDGGDIECCNSTQTVTALNQSLIAGLIGGVLPAIGTIVGLTCTPLSVLTALGQTCNLQKACCTGNNFNGVVVFGCNNINI